LDRLLPNLDVEGEGLLQALEAPTELDVRYPSDQPVADVVTPPEPAGDRRASIVS
jgi:hypothetical protein